MLGASFALAGILSQRVWGSWCAAAANSGEGCGAIPTSSPPPSRLQWHLNIKNSTWLLACALTQRSGCFMYCRLSLPALCMQLQYQRCRHGASWQPHATQTPHTGCACQLLAFCMFPYYHCNPMYIMAGATAMNDVAVYCY